MSQSGWDTLLLGREPFGAGGPVLHTAAGERRTAGRRSVRSLNSRSRGVDIPSPLFSFSFFFLSFFLSFLRGTVHTFSLLPLPSSRSLAFIFLFLFLSSFLRVRGIDVAAA
ncbi:hypothetical protein B0H16DRAFT_1577685, partial [Mycena metata]